VAYSDLGKYTFTTAADYTGLNAGNLTSILALTSLRIPYFEMYRLLINTSTVPPVASLPAIVQQTPLIVGTSLTSLALTFPAATTVGNTVAAAVGAYASGVNPAVTAVTLGGSADHWGAAASQTNTSVGYATLWADPKTAEASTTVAATLAGGSGTVKTAGIAWEMSGMLSTSSAAACIDPGTGKSAFSEPDVTSLATPSTSTSAADDMLLGFGVADTTAGTFAVSGPAAWSNVIEGPSVSSGTYIGEAASSVLAGPARSSGIYQLTAAGRPVQWSLVTAALLASTAAPVPLPLPFTVAIDGVTWDKQQTAAGIGYTYTIGQSPLYLTNGQTLQILWDLPVAQYGSYAGAFNITGWFRYDPSVQP
jgi:hypothetical protein